MKKPILVSACLLGTPCRYDGRSKPHEKVISLKDQFQLIPICPEVMGGLTTPRLPCERKDGKVICKDGADCTADYLRGARAALAAAKKHGCRLAILKEKSPSCGIHYRYDGSFSATLTEGCGITTELLRSNGIKVISENELDQIR